MTQTLPLWKNGKEDEQLDNHVLSDVDIEEPAPDTMINRQAEPSGSDRPQRTRTIPKRFDDYVLATRNETIPKDYDEAIACEDKKHWENAMLEEIQNMYSHQVWELVPRPVNAKVVKIKWVFKISKDQESKTYKARLVAMGYNQIPGRDYNESFSPVIKNATLRTILSMAATKDSVIKLFDVKAAYLNGNIENTIFMEQPAGFVQDRNKVCKLNKSIYRYLNPEDRDSEDTSNRFINKLRHHLEIKDVTCKGMFLGIKIIQDKEGISLQQSHYVQQILQKYGMETCKEVPTPGSKEINLDNHIEDDNCDQHTYQEALGMLMFLAVNTRPDIAYITSKLSQYSRQPKQMHWTAIKRVMRYLRGTIDLGVKFERGKTGILKSYTDASWSTTHDGKSYGGYVLKLGEATIDWKSSKQPLVALSTMEAEMIAACESCCQIKWIINLLRELEEWNFMEKPTAIYTDSQSLINWISSPKQSSRCRHINRKYHFLRDCYESRDICLLYKPSQDLEADIFTKDLSRDQMKKHLESLSIVGIKPNHLPSLPDNASIDPQTQVVTLVTKERQPGTGKPSTSLDDWDNQFAMEKDSIGFTEVRARVKRPVNSKAIGRKPREFASSSGREARSRRTPNNKFKVQGDVLLPTLRVTLKGNRTEKTARAIIDTGSQRSYILHSTAMEMEYEQSRREFFRHSLFGGSSTDVVEHEVYTIHLSDINNSYRCEFEALGQPLICGSIPPVCPRSLLEGSEELDVSDLMRDRIEVLIGADIAGRLLTDYQRRISSGLVAIRTKLGWTVMGKIPPTEVRDDISSLCVTTLLSLDLENLWKLDAIGVSDAEVEKKTQSLQAEMEEHFAHTTTRDIEGRYEVALPWVQEKERIPSNKDLAENQLRSVRRKLEEVGDMKEYGQIFEEWMKQGIIEYAREDKLDGVHYLPHRPVYKRNSQTSRIRPVFNASARKRDKAPEHLKITAEQLKSSFYVDNCLSSFQNVEETEKFVKESTELLSTACFNLRDWDSYVEKTTLHIFCDASQFAYATCIFLRIEKEDRVDIQLIQARTRVAPLKKLTIPRLELLACLIGARLAANVIQDLEFEEIPRFYWTDSTNALCWIQREDNWAAFVMNRVKEIHNLSSPESWRHIPGRLNPADLPSRGCSAESLKETRWWEGPAWLKVSQEEWPKSTIIPDLEIVYSERRKTILNTLCTTRENENLFGRYSHFLRIVRITAWIYRFFNNAKIDRRKIISEDLSTEEITKSEIILIRLIQRESFSGHEDKKLQGFKLLVDSSGILRIKTKICRREDFANFRMPILLPSDHFLVSLLIRWNHETHGHAGLQTLLGILRENYWILRSRKTVKKIINQCIRCKRFTATPATVESTSLPEDRVRDAAVFEIVGVDLTGHLILKNKKKAWIVIFTCAVYRGVHLELVTSLSMEAFLQAFRRFIARRGRPLIVYSDNGTNFKGIANALKKIDFSRLKCDPTLKNITWKFIPPGAPWWGGWWERLIGMMKQLLFRILGQTSLGYEELSTVMCDVESLMNTRPLTYLTEESEDLAPLTPSLFLHEVREVGVPDLDLIDNQTLSRKYQYIKRVREDLRERFRIEYFGFLRQETRRLKTTIPLKVGDMVLIGQESLKRLHWPLARIIQLYPGKDGLVRVAKVKTSSGDKIRPIQKLYNLEITPEIRCRDPLTERSPTQEVRLTTEEDPLTSQQEQHHIDTPNVVSSYGRPIKRPNRLDLLNFSFPCLSRRDANSKCYKQRRVNFEPSTPPTKNRALPPAANVAADPPPRDTERTEEVVGSSYTRKSEHESPKERRNMAEIHMEVLQRNKKASGDIARSQ
ncbi:hypothetical protein LAZ67_2003803 [Cordylochernes scorpioides]|uniref:Gag-Pol-p199 n=1 Tax=Cordylochernes scorpioides TaxID=51811 RepID=A0ABY6K4X0_9ARAC|nr:hypothetical protein LAZ67_2003803 [Cordylochernes scorpioides]